MSAGRVVSINACIFRQLYSESSPSRAKSRAAIAARSDATAGVPVVFYHIIPRRPSMLYYGGYSPLERKEEPLLPFLRAQMRAPTFTADVVTAGDIYAGKLQQELAKAPDLTAVLVDQEGTERGGWVLVRIRKK